METYQRFELIYPWGSSISLCPHNMQIVIWKLLSFLHLSLSLCNCKKSHVNAHIYRLLWSHLFTIHTFCTVHAFSCYPVINVYTKSDIFHFHPFIHPFTSFPKWAMGLRYVLEFPPHTPPHLITSRVQLLVMTMMTYREAYRGWVGWRVFCRYSGLTSGELSYCSGLYPVNDGGSLDLTD